MKQFVGKFNYPLEGIFEFGDKTAKTEDGKFTFQEIRAIEPSQKGDRRYKNELKSNTKNILKNEESDYERPEFKAKENGQNWYRT